MHWPSGAGARRAGGDRERERSPSGLTGSREEGPRACAPVPRPCPPFLLGPRQRSRTRRSQLTQGGSQSVSSEGANGPFFFIPKADSLECPLGRVQAVEEVGAAHPCRPWGGGEGCGASPAQAFPAARSPGPRPGAGGNQFPELPPGTLRPARALVAQVHARREDRVLRRHSNGRTHGPTPVLPEAEGAGVLGRRRSAAPHRRRRFRPAGSGSGTRL